MEFIARSRGRLRKAGYMPKKGRYDNGAMNFWIPAFGLVAKVEIASSLLLAMTESAFMCHCERSEAISNAEYRVWQQAPSQE